MRLARGSSPLTRGKLRAGHRSAPRPGLIPAHAGKTSRAPPTTYGPWAHPRSRGENIRWYWYRFQRFGSSPLTRGKRQRRSGRRRQTGLIPAHAGKTRQALYRFDPTAAHPRSRGENAPDQPTIQSTRGSSPLTRGKPGMTVGGQLYERLIPAHAGKTSNGARTLTPPTAHPRSRGENGL